MELKLITSTVALGFDFELGEQSEASRVSDAGGVLRKPVSVW